MNSLLSSISQGSHNCSWYCYFEIKVQTGKLANCAKVRQSREDPLYNKVPAGPAVLWTPEAFPGPNLR